MNHAFYSVYSRWLTTVSRLDAISVSVSLLGYELSGARLMERNQMFVSKATFCVCLCLSGRYVYVFLISVLFIYAFQEISIVSLLLLLFVVFHGYFVYSFFFFCYYVPMSSTVFIFVFVVLFQDYSLPYCLPKLSIAIITIFITFQNSLLSLHSAIDIVFQELHIILTFTLIFLLVFNEFTELEAIVVTRTSQDGLSSSSLSISW